MGVDGFHTLVDAVANDEEENVDELVEAGGCDEVPSLAQRI